MTISSEHTSKPKPESKAPNKVFQSDSVSCCGFCERAAKARANRVSIINSAPLGGSIRYQYGLIGGIVSIYGEAGQNRG
jgi:hypothetical protein